MFSQPLSDTPIAIYFSELKKIEAQSANGIMAAIYETTQLIRKYPAWTEAYALRAKLYERLDTPELQLADHDYSAILTIDPHNERILLEKIRIAKKINPSSVEELTRLWKKESKEMSDFRYWYHLELVTFLGPYFDREMAKYAMKLSPEMQDFFNSDLRGYTGPLTTHSAHHARLGMVALTEKNISIALYHFECALQLFRHDIISACFFAFLKHEFEKNVYSYSLFSELADLYQYPIAYLFRAAILDLTERKEEAYENIINFLKLGNASHFLRFQNKIDLILKYVLKCFPINEEKAKKEVNEAQLQELIKQHKYRKAIIANINLIHANSTNSKLYFTLYKCLQKLSQKKEALLALSTGILLASTSQDLKQQLLDRTLLLIDTDLPLNSLVDFCYGRQVFTPEDEEIYLNAIKKKALSLISTNDYQLLLYYFDTFLKLAKNSLIFRLKGDCLIKLGRLQEGLDCFVKSQQLEDTTNIRERIKELEDKIIQAANNSERVLNRALLALKNGYNEIRQLIESPPSPNIKTEVTPEKKEPRKIKKNLAAKVFKNDSQARHKATNNVIEFKSSEDSATEKKPPTFNFFAEQKRLRDQEITAKLEKERLRKLRKKENDKQKKLTKFESKKTNANTSSFEENNSNLSADSFQDYIFIDKEKDCDLLKIKIPNEVEKVFSHVRTYLENKPHLNKCKIQLSGGSAVDLIRLQLRANEMPQLKDGEEFLLKEIGKVETDYDYITNLPCPELLKIFPEGKFNENIDGCFSIWLLINNKNIKIDIFCLPDLRHETILNHKDFFPFVVEDTGIVIPLTPWAIETLKENILRPIHPNNPFKDPIVLLRTPYQAIKRELKLTNQLDYLLRKEMYKLLDRNLVTTEKVNYWVNQLFSYHKADRNFQQLLEYNVFATLFPYHIREIVNSKEWLAIQMANTAETAQHTIIQRIYSSFVIAIAMQHLKENIVMGDIDCITYENIYNEANQIIRGNNFFAATFLTGLLPENNPMNLPSVLTSYLNPAIKCWIEIYPDDTPCETSYRTFRP